MERSLEKDCDPCQPSSLALAFVGDGVSGPFVRERLICQANYSVNTLHKDAVAQMCCGAQAQAVQKLIPLFTGEEETVFRRGRNAKTSHVPENPSSVDCHAVTALETSFGYSYLRGESARLHQFFVLICEE